MSRLVETSSDASMIMQAMRLWPTVFVLMSDIRGDNNQRPLANEGLSSLTWKSASPSVT